MKRLLLLIALLSVSDITNAAPPCWFSIQYPPKIIWDDVPQWVQSTSKEYALWICNTPTGYVTWRMLFNWNEATQPIADFITHKLSPQQANALYDSTAVALTPSEDAFLLQQYAKYHPVAQVEASGAAHDRATYAAAAVTVDATGKITIGKTAQQRIAVGSPCNEMDRLTGTNLYAVDGQLDTTGAVIVKMYAPCTVTFFITPN